MHPAIPTLTAVMALASIPAQGGQGRLQNGVVNGLEAWKFVRLPAKQPAQFRRLPDGSIGVTAKSGFGLIYMPVEGEKADRRKLSWRWRVDAAPRPTDLSKRGGDDRPLAVHVWFAPDGNAASAFSLLTRMRARLAGLPASGAVITYVWGGTAPRGAVMKNPYLKGDAALIVLRNGRARKGRWIGEMIDAAADFRKAFGRKAPAITHIAISADTDDRGGLSRARITPIRFGGR